jgi:hypothetical protein
MKYEAQKKTAVVQKVIRRLNLVAWTGIEPVTRGFSTHHARKKPSKYGLISLIILAV